METEVTTVEYKLKENGKYTKKQFKYTYIKGKLVSVTMPGYKEIVK